VTRVLLLCPEPVRPTMAGVGIRFCEMARTLAGRFSVTLGIPNEPAQAPALDGVTAVRYDGETMARLCRQADAVVLHGHVSGLYLAAGVRRPLVVDLYDPFPVENLNYFPVLGDEPYRRDRATLQEQLREGDLFLCSSPEQRLLYLGMLLALGRLNPQTYVDDLTLERLVCEVPFGVPEEAPQPGGAVLRGVVPGIGADDPVVLFGGVYDWHDPVLLLRALPTLLREAPDLRVVFSTNPNLEVTPQGAYAEALDAARQAGWVDRHVFFLPWVPHDLRAGLYLESTVGAVLHLPRFETEVSMRTRVLEFLWAGLPTVVTAGGPASRLVADGELGLVVPHGDEQALTGALGRLIASEELRTRLAERGRRWAAGHTWRAVLQPLEEFLAEPRVDPHKHRYPPLAPPFRETGAGQGWLSRLVGRG